MEATSDEAPSPLPAQGGTVERAPGRPSKQEPRSESARSRYELRDPFAEVTYRADSLEQIIATADRLGSSRFTVVAPGGERSVVTKKDGRWELPSPPQAKDRTDDQASAPAQPRTVGQTTGDRQAPKLPGPESGPDKAKEERDANAARLEAALMDRYVIKRAPIEIGDVSLGRTEYRFKGDVSRVAFTATQFRLATETNSPSVARSMVDVAEARQWRSLRVSGAEDFRRMVWLEASARGVRTIGYDPNPVDLEMLRKERDARQSNRVERMDAPTADAPTADRPSARGGSGRKAVIAAIEAVLVAKQVPEKQRQLVLAAATEQLAARLRAGQSSKVKMYDVAAPSQRVAVAPAHDVQRSRDRSAPTR